MASTSDSTTDAPVINPKKDPAPAAAAAANQPATTDETAAPAEKVEWELAAPDDPGGDDKALVLSGLATKFTVTTSDDTTYELSRVPVAVPEKHLQEVRQAGMNHRIKIRTMKAVPASA